MIVFSVSLFVLTATLRKSYEVALMAVGQKWPVLLYGPVGAGKTALINKLAQIVGNRGIYDICYEDFIQVKKCLKAVQLID